MNVVEEGAARVASIGQTKEEDDAKTARKEERGTTRRTRPGGAPTLTLLDGCQPITEGFRMKARSGMASSD